MVRRYSNPNLKHKRRQREFVRFLAWLEDGPKPWKLTSKINEWRAQYEYWESVAERRGALGTMPTDAPRANAYAMRRAFYYAKRMHHIEIQKKGKRLLVALTQRGQILLLKHHVKEAPVLTQHQAILVMFDVPVSQRQVRQRIRYFLRELGFHRLQQSVWFSQRDVIAALHQYFHTLKLDDWVSICFAEFKKDFHLSCRCVKDENKAAAGTKPGRRERES